MVMLKYVQKRTLQHDHTSTTEPASDKLLLPVKELVGSAVSDQDEAEGALTAVLIWLRFSSSRLLTWNKNYNIKPREISTAQVCHFYDVQLDQLDFVLSFWPASVPV